MGLLTLGGKLVVGARGASLTLGARGVLGALTNEAKEGVDLTTETFGTTGTLGTVRNPNK